MDDEKEADEGALGQWWQSKLACRIKSERWTPAHHTGAFRYMQKRCRCDCHRCCPCLFADRAEVGKNEEKEKGGDDDDRNDQFLQAVTCRISFKLTPKFPNKEGRLRRTPDTAEYPADECTLWIAFFM
jgi:hypothetical protein